MSQPIWFYELLSRLPPNLLEEYEERAGIIQYEAGFPKDHAECLALLCVLTAQK